MAIQQATAKLADTAKQAATEQVKQAPAGAAAPETKPADKPVKAPREVTVVKMSDGRDVEFVGKRKLLKDSIIDAAAKTVSVRLDFRNGKTLTFACPTDLVLKAAGHGLEQKLGDETAGTESVEDMVLEVEDLISRLAKGEWTSARASGDGFSGASVVIRAICEVTGKTVDEVKAFLQGKLDAAKAKGETLSRAALYASFRNPKSKTGPIIVRLEAEAAAGKSSINADDALAELGK